MKWMIDGLLAGMLLGLLVWFGIRCLRDYLRKNKRSADRGAQDLEEFVKPPASFTWDDREQR
jgi:hypothetical protein